MFRRHSILLFATTAFSLTLATPTSYAQPEADQSVFNQPAEFMFAANQIHMQGVIHGNGPNATLPRLRSITNQYPDVKTLVLHIVPGADDDDGAMSLYRFVRNQGMSTLVASDGLVASGGVDLFCAGVTRTVEPGAALLVHPWEDDVLRSGRNVAMNHPIHQSYITYYRMMGIGDEFYRRTLFAPLSTVNVPRSNGSVFEIPNMYRLTEQELQQYNLVTTPARQPGAQPGNAVAPGTILPERLIGTWKFRAPAGEVLLTLNRDSSMSFTVGSNQGGGSFALVGNQLTLNITGLDPVVMTLAGAAQNQIRMDDNTSWQRVNSQPLTGATPQAPAIDGQWREVRKDGRVKFISIQNGKYTENEGADTVTGNIEINGDRISLPGGSGRFETFLFEFEGGNRVIFMDPATEQLTRFHWIRL